MTRGLEVVALRPAETDDEQAAVTSLARAFWHDPFLVYFYPDEAVRRRRIVRFFRLLWRVSWPLGQIEVTQGCEAVVLWRPPHRWRIRPATIAANLPAMLRAYGSQPGECCTVCLPWRRSTPNNLTGTLPPWARTLRTKD